MSEFNPFVNAFTSLHKDNPNIFTTDGLSTLLSEYRHLQLGNIEPKVYPSLLIPEVALNLAGVPLESKDLWQRITIDPAGWALDASNDVQEGAKWYDNLGKMLGYDSISEVMTYHSVRDYVQEIQKHFNISGCHLVEQNIRGIKVNYGDKDDQLVLIPSDYRILKYYARRVIYKFLKVIKLEPSYNLFQLTDEEDRIPVTHGQVRILASKSVYAWIHTESLNWERSPNGGWSGHYVRDRVHPDKITLYLHTTWDEGEPGNCLTFEARHPDSARFPFE